MHVRARRDITGTEVRVYWALTDHIRPDSPWAFPSEDTLAELAGVCRRTVQRALDSLEAKGVIARERNGGGTFVQQGQLRGRPNRHAMVPLADSATPVAHSATPSDNGASLVSHKDSTEYSIEKRKKDCFRKEESGSPYQGQHNHEDVKRWGVMLNDEAIHGMWRFERETRSMIPKDVVANWERTHGGARAWARMLAIERERGNWPSFRVSKESIPADFIAQWEAANG